MGSYRLNLLKSSERDIRNIDKQQILRIVEAIRSLEEDPFPKQSKKLKASESAYRLRVGDYRILYEVDIHNKVVEIFHIRHRKDAYRQK